MNNQSTLIDFILKEWILVGSGVALVLTSLYTSHMPAYSGRDMQVLFILFVLFIATNGLQHSGFISWISRSLEKGKAVAFKFVLLTFFLSMLLSNDVALLAIVPLTLALDSKRKGMLVILEALAANAGSAFTPFGNPQNLFIYWFYDLHPLQFMASIAPFVVVFLVALGIAAWAIHIKSDVRPTDDTGFDKKASLIYGVLFINVLLVILHVLPMSAGFLVIVYALLFERKVLFVDYSLLFSFFFLFGLAENMKSILAYPLEHAGHVFLFSALASQLMSNVPTTLLFAKFTTNWEALLWGVSVGGFGGLFGSLANLIAYRLYVTHHSTDDTGWFTVMFLFSGYVAFFLGMGLYFACYA